MGRGIFIVIASSIFMSVVSSARADDAGDKGDLASAAYDRGAAAFDAKDYVRAAEEFSRADNLAPNSLALTLAIDSAMRAGRAALVMDFATRAEARLGDKTDDQAPALTALVQRAHAEYEDRTGTITVHCAPQHTCVAQIDDRAASLNTRSWIAIGRHVLAVRIDGRDERRDVVIPPREHVEVRAEEMLTEVPAAAPARSHSRHTLSDRSRSPDLHASRRPLSPTWFWVGAAATAALGGLTLASGIDTVRKHDDFESSPTSDRASAGREAQTRTNVLLGLTAITAVSTTAIAVFLVNWPSRTNPTRAQAPRTALGLGTCLTLTTKF